MSMRFLMCTTAAVLVAGCGAQQVRYDNPVEQNLTISVELDIKSGLFSSVDVVAGVNDFDAKCQPHYKGSVELAHGRNKIGLKPGQMTYLQVDVARDSRTQSSNFSRGTLLTPAKGKEYEIDIVYKNNMFDFRVYEVSGTGRKQMKIVPATDCKPS